MTSPDPMKECCDKCRGLPVYPDVQPYEATTPCTDRLCPCHKSSPAGWAEDFRKRYVWESGTIDHDGDEIIAFFEGVLAHRDAELVEKAKAKMLDSHEDILFMQGFNAGIAETISLITNREN